MDSHWLGLLFAPELSVLELEEGLIATRVVRQAKRCVGHGHTLILECTPAHSHNYTYPPACQFILSDVLSREHILKLSVKRFSLVELLIVLKHLIFVQDDCLQLRDQSYRLRAILSIVALRATHINIDPKTAPAF